MRWLLIGYMFLFIHRPFEVYPVLADVRLELLYMLLTGAVWLLGSRKNWLSNPMHWAYLSFASAVLVCWVASPWSSDGQLTVENYFKIIVFYLMLVTTVRDEQGLRRMIVAFLVVMSMYMAHSLLEYLHGRHTFRMGIARLVGIDTSLGDPNAFGATIVYSLPVALAVWQSRPSTTMRMALLGYVLLAVGCIALTGSRSSFVGLLIFAGLSVWRSRWRLPLALGCLLLMPLLWSALPAPLQNRFETIIHPEVGPANAQASAEGRIEGLYRGLDLWARHPITGCGPGVWRQASGAKLQAHNLYGQVLGEMGSLGGAAFLAIVLLWWRNARRISFLYRSHPEWGQDFLFHLNRALGVALFLLLFEGNFGHSLFRYTWVWYGAFLIITRHCVESRLAERRVYAERPVWNNSRPARMLPHGRGLVALRT